MFLIQQMFVKITQSSIYFLKMRRNRSEEISAAILKGKWPFQVTTLLLFTKNLDYYWIGGNILLLQNRPVCVQSIYGGYWTKQHIGVIIITYCEIPLLCSWPANYKFNRCSWKFSNAMSNCMVFLALLFSLFSTNNIITSVLKVYCGLVSPCVLDSYNFQDTMFYLL